jgi:hypothetical protein
MSDMPRRTLLLAGPAAAVVAAVAAETGIALARTADPYIGLCADYRRTDDALNASGLTDAEAETICDEHSAICRRIVATKATTVAGAVAGLRIALAEFNFNHRHYEIGDPTYCLGDHLMVALLESAIAVLERETAHV